LQSALWTWLQAAVASLSEAELQKKFEVVAVLQRLQSAERAALERIETAKSLATDVNRAAAALAPH